MKIPHLIRRNPFSTLSKIFLSGAVLFSTLLIINYTYKWFQDRQSPHKGAGILPYTVQNHEVYFLLSKEGYGPAANTWYEFDGGKEKGETAIQTAVREGWEESRGILGDKKMIESKISPSCSIGPENYKIFLIEIQNPEAMTNGNFLKREFRQTVRMEKTEIAWVRADELFHASKNPSTAPLKLRGSFAKIMRDAVNDPKQKKVLEGICNIETVPLKQAS